MAVAAPTSKQPLAQNAAKSFQAPPHDWGEKTPWRLFNAAPFALAGKVTENPPTTRKLHDVVDGVCVALN